MLVVDDDAGVRELQTTALAIAGFDTATAADGMAALDRIHHWDPDLIVLDVTMPGLDGLEVLARLRTTADTPVILVTARQDESDRLRGFELGADDFVPKPFSALELAARVRSVLRRSSDASVGTEEPQDLGPVRIDRRSRQVAMHGRPVHLTPLEFDLLVFLADAPEVVFTRDRLLREVWGSSSEWQDPATVTEHVRRLRGKLGAGTGSDGLIETVRGVGYRLSPP